MRARSANALLVIAVFGDRRLVLPDLLVIGAHLRVELRLALRVVRALQRAVGGEPRVGVDRVIERLLRQFGLGAGDLRVEVGELRLQGADIGAGEGRVERGEHLPFLDPLAFLDVEALDDRLVERLQYDGRIDADDLAIGGRHHPVDPHRDRDDQQHGKHADQREQRDAQLNGLGPVQYLRRFGLEAPDFEIRLRLTRCREDGTE